MKIFCVYTPAHEILLREWFLPSIPEGFEPQPIPLEIKGAGDFLSKEFLRCIRAKIDQIIGSIRDNDGDWIIWSDIDILFFEGSSDAIQDVIRSAGDKDMFFQRETKTGGEVNTGFILIRCGETAEHFFVEVGARLGRETGKNEQAVENEMLKEGAGIRWGHLPISFVARTHGWPPPRNMAIYHANYTLGTDGVGQKITQFKAVLSMQRHGLPAVAFFTAKRVLEKLQMAIGLGAAK